MVCTICVVTTEVQKQGSLKVLLLFEHICYLLPEIPSLSCIGIHPDLTSREST
jgi:hypothetical protein